MTAETSFRLQYIKEHLELCENNWQLMNMWEQEFINNIRNLKPLWITQKQYNTLHRIAEKIKKDLLSQKLVNDGK